MKRMLRQLVLYVLVFAMGISVIPSASYAAEPVSLEIVAEYWGSTESTFTVRCTGIEDVSQITVWATVFRGPMFYGFAIAESDQGEDGMFHISVKHLPFEKHDNATVKVFLLDATSFAPQSEAAQEDQIMETQKVYKTYLDEDVESLNFLDNVDSNAATPASYAMSQLWRMYPNEKGTGYIWIDDLAVGDPVQIDDYNWKIRLRQDATFQDGTPITADTWIYTWQQMLDPKLNLNMAYSLYEISWPTVAIAGAENYFFQGASGYPSEVTWDEVGIKKVNDYTIQITLTSKVNDPSTIKSHFDNWNHTPIHPGMWEACMSEDGTSTVYGSSLEYFIGCGPYVFAEWDYNERHVYVKNDSHWLAEYLHFDQIQVRIVPEMNKRIELFEQGEIHDLTPDANTLEQYIDDPRMTTYGSLSVPHIDINCKNPNNPVSGSVNYRKAIYHAVNREFVAESIFGHMKPVGTYINEQAGLLSASGLTYRESKYGQAVTDLVESWSAEGEHYGYNPALALDYLNKAIAECNVTEDQLPIKVILATDEGDLAWKAFSEYLMEEWKVIFEGKLEFIYTPYAGMSATAFKQTGDDKWDLSPNDWTRSAARQHPFAAFYYYLSSYSGRPNNYTDAEFEAQYAYCDSIKLGDYETLLAETQKLEELYLEKVIHVPIYQYINYELFADELVLPVKTYIPGFGWGANFGDWAE